MRMEKEGLVSREKEKKGRVEGRPKNNSLDSEHAFVTGKMKSWYIRLKFSCQHVHLELAVLGDVYKPPCLDKFYLIIR